jgi:hypothetical protein
MLQHQKGLFLALYRTFLHVDGLLKINLNFFFQTFDINGPIAGTSGVAATTAGVGKLRVYHKKPPPYYLFNFCHLKT